MSQQRKAWDSACRAWSLDDGKDPEKTGALGERLMYAATDLICDLESVIDDCRTFIDRYSDTVDGYCGEQDANEAMQIVVAIDALMSEMFESAAPEAMDRAADQFQECGKHILASEYRAIADRQRAVIAKMSRSA